MNSKQENEVFARKIFIIFKKLNGMIIMFDWLILSRSFHLLSLLLYNLWYYFGLQVRKGIVLVEHSRKKRKIVFKDI